MLPGTSQRNKVVVSCVITVALCVLMWRQTTHHLHSIKKSVTEPNSLNHEKQSGDEADITSPSISTDTTIETGDEADITSLSISTDTTIQTGDKADITSLSISADTTIETGDEVDITSLSNSADTTIETKPAKNEMTPLPSIPAYDVMPYSARLRSRAELQKTQWVATLHEYLQTLNKSISPHVNIVFGDHAHGRLVLNWITSALKILQPPLHNVMVLSLDHLLCDSLTNRSFPLTCIAVPAESIFTTNATNEYRVGVMVRFPVLRLINYWGYDVASYDSDAVLLHNPQVLYTERPSTDFFSGAGTYPNDVSKRWGFTLCAGSLMLRASPAVDVLWSRISAVPIIGEQASLNQGMLAMAVVWKQRTKDSKICTVKGGWESEGAAIRVFVFPQNQFCRGCCKETMSRKKLYVIHPVTGKTDMKEKEHRLKRMRAWCLNKEHLKMA